MPETEGDARLEGFLRDEIPRLASLYDRFAHALDPFDRERDMAEQTFGTELAVILRQFARSETGVSGFPAIYHRALPTPPCGQRQAADAITA